uniref:Uncharacterized protein n=1 Tax=Megaselia scalaris TaxID=36166 RepID=T1GSZ1_MEGSC
MDESVVTTTTTLENKYEQLKNDMNSSVFCSTIPPDNEQHKYPDLLDVYKSGGKSSSIPATSSGICTLPRKLKNTGKYFKNSTDSQSPLLADCSSKTGSSLLGDPNSLLDFSTNGRRFSAESYNNQPGYYAIRPNSQRCSSFLNLVQTAKPVVHRKNPSLPSSPVRESTATHQRSLSSAATPLLDFSSLITTRAGAAMQHSSKMNPYDYHAAQLERFLEEYRNLQEQLCKMKETCDSIRKKDAPLRGALGHSAQFADPIMFDAAINSNSLVNLDTHSNPKTVLKSKPILPGQPPDPPPYWLHRNTVLKRLNDAQNDYFKS